MTLEESISTLVKVMVAIKAPLTENQMIALGGSMGVIHTKIEQDEREACAEMVDHIFKEGGGTYGDAIRARGEQHG